MATTNPSVKGVSYVTPYSLGTVPATNPRPSPRLSTLLSSPRLWLSGIIPKFISPAPFARPEPDDPVEAAAAAAAAATPVAPGAPLPDPLDKPTRPLPSYSLLAEGITAQTELSLTPPPLVLLTSSIATLLIAIVLTVFSCLFLGHRYEDVLDDAGWTPAAVLVMSALLGINAVIGIFLFYRSKRRTDAAVAATAPAAASTGGRGVAGGMGSLNGDDSLSSPLLSPYSSASGNSSGASGINGASGSSSESEEEGGPVANALGNVTRLIASAPLLLIHYGIHVFLLVACFFLAVGTAIGFSDMSHKDDRNGPHSTSTSLALAADAAGTAAGGAVGTGGEFASLFLPLLPPSVITAAPWLTDAAADAAGASADGGRRMSELEALAGGRLFRSPAAASSPAAAAATAAAVNAVTAVPALVPWTAQAGVPHDAAALAAFVAHSQSSASAQEEDGNDVVLVCVRPLTSSKEDDTASGYVTACSSSVLAPAPASASASAPASASGRVARCASARARVSAAAAAAGEPALRCRAAAAATAVARASSSTRWEGVGEWAGSVLARLAGVDTAAPTPASLAAAANAAVDVSGESVAQPPKLQAKTWLTLARLRVLFIILLLAVALTLGLSLRYGISVHWASGSTAATVSVGCVGAVQLLFGLAAVFADAFTNPAGGKGWIMDMGSACGGLCIGAGVLALLCLVLSPGMGLDASVMFYSLCTYAAAAVAVVGTIASVWELRGHVDSSTLAVLELHILVFTVACGVAFAARAAMASFALKSLPSGLGVEVLDVNALTPAQKAQWAAAMDAALGLGACVCHARVDSAGVPVPGAAAAAAAAAATTGSVCRECGGHAGHCGAWDGAGALEMMRAYARAGIKDIEGVVLHLYDIAKEEELREHARAEAETEAAMGMGQDDNPFVSSPSFMRSPAAAAAAAGYTSTDYVSLNEIERGEAGSISDRTPRERRAAASAAHATAATAAAAIGAGPSGGKSRRELAPRAFTPRPSSHALVYVTVIHKLDLTKFMPVGGFCGADSWLQWFVFRFALVGFHWPFTSGVFLVKHLPSDPAAEAAEDAAAAAAAEAEAAAKKAAEEAAAAEAAATEGLTASAARKLKKAKKAAAAAAALPPAGPRAQPGAHGADAAVYSPPYTQHTVDGVARALRAVIELNAALPTSRRITMLLAPLLKTEPLLGALLPHQTGFVNAPMPPTAVVDLRRHRGRTWGEFMTLGMKKGNRRHYDKGFEADGGTIHYIDHCNPWHGFSAEDKALLLGSVPPGAPSSARETRAAEAIAAQCENMTPREFVAALGEAAAARAAAAAAASGPGGYMPPSFDPAAVAAAAASANGVPTVSSAAGPSGFDGGAGDAFSGRLTIEVHNSTSGGDMVSGGGYFSEEEVPAEAVAAAPNVLFSHPNLFYGGHNPTLRFMPPPEAAGCAAGAHLHTRTPAAAAAAAAAEAAVAGAGARRAVPCEATHALETTPQRLETSYPEWVDDFQRLWQMIASARVDQGDDPVLFNPTASLFRSIGAMDPCNRSLLVLKLNGRAIGSSVVFKFPKTRMMTCDIQGLDHALGRKAKAYFIMLHRSVRMALEQGYDYVNFGPTTLGPKTDAGAYLIPSALGLYATSPALRVAMVIGMKGFAAHQSLASNDTVTEVTVGEGGVMQIPVSAADEDEAAAGADAVSPVSSPAAGAAAGTAGAAGGAGAGAGAGVALSYSSTSSAVTSATTEPSSASHPAAVPAAGAVTAAAAAAAAGDDIDIEVLMAMDPSQMTGSQKKRYNKEKKKRTAKAAKQGGPVAAAASAPAGAAAALPALDPSAAASTAEDASAPASAAAPAPVAALAAAPAPVAAPAEASSAVEPVADPSAVAATAAPAATAGGTNSVLTVSGGNKVAITLSGGGRRKKKAGEAHITVEGLPFPTAPAATDV